MLTLQAKVAASAFEPGECIAAPYTNNPGMSIPTYKTGVFAAYRRLNSQWGFKLYATKKQRDEIYDRQVKAHKAGIGPVTDGKFKATTQGKHTVYGYVTEHIVQVMGEMDPETRRKYKYDYDYVVRKGKEMGIDDIHMDNVGINGNGCMVIIDFSHTNKYTDHSCYELGALSLMC